MERKEMKKTEIANTADQVIAKVQRLPLKYVQRVRKIRKGMMHGDQMLAAIATGYSARFVLMVICFGRRNEKILKTLERIQRSRAELLAASPRFTLKRVYQLDDNETTPSNS